MKISQKTGWPGRSNLPPPPQAIISALALFAAGLIAIGCTASGADTEGGRGPAPPKPDISFEILNPDTSGPSAKGALEGTEFTVKIPNSWDKTSLFGKFTLPAGATVAPDPSTEAIDYTRASTFDITKASGEIESYTVIVNYQFSTINDIKSFKIGDREGDINDAANTIHVSLAYSTEPVGSHTPVVELLDDRANYSPAGEQDFTNSAAVPVQYTVNDEAGNPRVYYVRVARAANNANKITAFSVYTADTALAAVLSQMPSPIITEGTPGSINLTIPSGMSKTFTPAIAYEGDEISPASGEEKDFTSAQTYTVTAANGDVRTYNVSVTEAAGIAANLTSVTSSSTTPGTATAHLTLNFDVGVPTLDASNIGLVAAAGGSITKGALSAQDSEYRVWQLAVSGITKNNLSVSVDWASDPLGFELGGFSKTAAVQSSIFQFESLSADETDNEPGSTKLTITFDALVPGLSADDFTLTPGTLTKGELTHESGGVYTLEVGNISTNGLSTQVSVANAQYTFEQNDKTISLKWPIPFGGLKWIDGITTTAATLVLEFGQAVPGGLSKEDITLSPALAKGTLADKGGGKYELPLSSLTGDVISVSVTPAKDGWTFKQPVQNIVICRASGSQQTWSAPYDGIYKFELWGGQGGNGSATGGKGGYTYGNIRLNQGESLSLYAGKKGGNRSGRSCGTGGYNGGGNGGEGGGTNPLGAGGGGGATDVRRGGELLSHRIIIAGGGGGGCGRASADIEKQVGGGGGGLQGTAGSSGGDGRGASGAKWNAEGTAHTAGNNSGVGGVGASGNGTCYEGDGGGGGGCYGGLANTAAGTGDLSGGGGGSSFVDTSLFTTGAGGLNGGDAAQTRTGDGQIIITW
ncbi:MAG: hypothetical protein LBC77_09080 [Spirochaetaceae bacterium]|jgi:hypothetical protein|nr:hypothetical protein [Spirochaetaceae bacterium]